ncbi:plasmid stabilization system protein ParE [Prosthecobacter fusiformis]|uniref:Plasmid stabilization system protein ParE n=1 Tax=Prosthecobacter fusiformis TaxID=48464 RepID=A0A4R7RK59_9BACT|nr:type II toxin-antitoxin system RelE/ParE family toxin [Prosthecobacter fusiformis]TDU63205.1 plasmid stabilization system protein ParE [Prosthecobacter fusiformis]
MNEFSQHPEVENEIEEIVIYLEGTGLWNADRFIERFRESLRGILQNPKSCHFVHESYRRSNLKQFPYAIIYRERKDDVHVIAVMHTKRHPDYWKTRIQDDHE